MDQPKSDDQQRRTGRFIHLGEVNRGGMGRIEAAHDPVIGRRVALKALRPELEDEPVVIHRFNEEACITGQLEHPNIVPIYDLGEQDGSPFIAMKLVKGQSLGQMLGQAGEPGKETEELQRLIRIVLCICDALSFAHSRGVIHCDLKPDNVMVGDHGEVYVMDWGTAALLSRRHQSRAPAENSAENLIVLNAGDPTQSGVLKGTPAYMAPEQLLGRTAEIDQQTDVFGVGGILHEILTRRPPNSQRRLLTQAFTASPVSLSSRDNRWPQLPPELVRITLRALAARPAERYPSIRDLQADLEQFMRGGGWFETQHFAPGATIVEEGDAGNAAYIIERGECDVYKNVQGKRVLLRRLSPGDVFGEMAVLTGAPRSASVVASGEVVVKIITGESLNRELDRNPWLGAFVRQLAGRFREMDERLSGSGTPTMPQ
jgi:serine/threonine protein kinase